MDWGEGGKVCEVGHEEKSAAAAEVNIKNKSKMQQKYK